MIFWEKGELSLLAHLYAIKYVLRSIILLKILFCLKIHVKGIFRKKVLPYPTLPHPTLPYATLSYPILSYSTLPYSTQSYPTLPYPTLPYATLPYSALSYSHSLMLYWCENKWIQTLSVTQSKVSSSSRAFWLLYQG